MQRLKLYEIDVEYMEYLYGYDNRVMYWDSEHYRTDRKYVGVVLKINDFEYFAPLSSPKDTDYCFVANKKVVRKNTIPIVRLVTDKGKLLAKVKLGNMIPVKQECVKLYDVDGEKNRKYRELIEEELICIRKSRNEIIKNARVLYNQKIKEYKVIRYLDSVLDFKLLESACLKYHK